MLLFALLGTSASCMLILLYAMFVYEYWGLGFSESVKFIFTGQIVDHHKKTRVKPGDVVLLVTKYGFYPTKVQDNHKFAKTMIVEPDPWMYWIQWNYSDIELLDNNTKKILYG